MRKAERKKPLIIDAHNHPDWHGHDLESFIENMDRYGIARTWLLPWICAPQDYDPVYVGVTPSCLGEADGPIPFSRCLTYKEREPDRFVLGYAPDPRRPDALDRMRSAIDIFGARVCGEFKHRIMLDNPDALRLFRFCGERGVPVTFHLDYEFDSDRPYPRLNYWYGGGIEALERAVRQCPDTVFIGHAPGFWAHISGDRKQEREMYPAGRVKGGGKLIKLFRRYGNLFADLSGASGYNALHRDPQFARGFVLEFQDRLLYGRDDFNNDQQELLGSLRLPKTVLSKVYSGNALKLAPEG